MTRHVQTNFRAEDFERASSPSAAPAKKEAAPAPKKEAEADPNQVPDGTTDEVRDWVGDDVTRAKKALAAEKKSDDPRVTLTGPLERMIEDDKEAKKQAAAEKKAAKKSE